MTRRMGASTAIGLALAVLLAGTATAEEVVNLYSARHYDTDQAMYDEFTKATGITVRLIEGKDDEIVERLKQEGAASPADVLILVDAGRLWRAEQAGVLAPVRSAVLEERLPARLRDPDGYWFGFSQRARVIYVDANAVDPALVQTYEDLARPELKGKVCIRSSTNIYNLSLMASLIERVGPEQAEAWARSVVANFARDPQGGDTDQIKAVAAGECAVALGNHYYWARLFNSKDPAERAIAEKVTVVWPNQASSGTHVNISGAGLAAHAPHKDAAIKFLEYLASDGAQSYFAAGNNEYPAVPGVEYPNPALERLGPFKAEAMNVAVYGENQPQAQAIYDKVGWK